MALDSMPIWMRLLKRHKVNGAFFTLRRSNLSISSDSSQWAALKRRMPLPSLHSSQSYGTKFVPCSIRVKNFGQIARTLF